MSIPGCVIEPARAEDFDAVARLLAAAGLAHDDLRGAAVRFVVARVNGGVVGAAGAEVRGDDGLLRSLVVAPDRRRTGLGSALLRRLDAQAAGWGVKRWWLLTTTAESFFRARGFVPAARATAPALIRATGQFTGDVCASAACLTRTREEAS